MASCVLLHRIWRPPEDATTVLVLSKLIVWILPIAQIATGAKYMKECPRQDNIPIYLVVLGVFSLMLTVLSWLPCARESEEGTSRPLNSVCAAWNSIVSLFLFCWFIAGNVWIYSIYEPSYNKTTPHDDKYCNKTLYLFAFWTTTLDYIILGVFLVIKCCVLVCFSICGQADPDD